MDKGSKMLLRLTYNRKFFMKQKAAQTGPEKLVRDVKCEKKPIHLIYLYGKI